MSPSLARFSTEATKEEVASAEEEVENEVEEDEGPELTESEFAEVVAEEEKGESALALEHHMKIKALPCISEMCATKTPKEVAEMMTAEEIDMQMQKYAHWLRCLRRHVRPTKRKSAVRKKGRRSIKLRLNEREVLKEASYWQNWQPGDVAYQK